MIIIPVPSPAIKIIVVISIKETLLSKKLSLFSSVFFVSSSVVFSVSSSDVCSSVVISVVSFSVTFSCGCGE